MKKENIKGFLRKLKIARWCTLSLTKIMRKLNNFIMLSTQVQIYRPAEPNPESGNRLTDNLIYKILDTILRK